MIRLPIGRTGRELRTHLAASGWNPAVVDLFTGCGVAEGDIAAACGWSPGMVADLAVTVGRYFEARTAANGPADSSRIPDELTELAEQMKEHQ